MATSRPQTSTSTSAAQKISTLVQKARSTSPKESRISGRKKKVRPTATSLAMMNNAIASTSTTVAA
jgi:hypothetical protein